jgi:protein-disulfide isomerase
MHDKLFANQHALGRQDLERYAKEMGLDMRKFRRALDTDAHADVIDRQIRLGTNLGFRGTPAFYMNGRFIPGLPLPAWESAIRLRGPIYRRMVQTGVSRSQLYEVLIADGKKTL